MTRDDKELCATLQTALEKFNADFVHPTYKSHGLGLHEFPFQNCLISVNFPKNNEYSRALFKILRNKVVIGLGYFSLTDHSVQIDTIPHSNDLSYFLRVLTPKENKGDVVMDIGGNPYAIAFLKMMKKFNDVIVQQTYKSVGHGVYEWPVSNYTISVTFPNAHQPIFAPFKILRGKAVHGEGHFDLGGEQEVNITSLPSDSDMAGLNLALSNMLDTSLASTNENPAADTPVLLNGTEINDEWIEWYRKQNPGCGYAAAVVKALKWVQEEGERMQAVLDKYKFPS